MVSTDGFDETLLVASNIILSDITQSAHCHPISNIKMQKYLLPNGNYFKGLHDQYGLLHGHGHYLYADGSVYIGHYRRGLRQGQGKFVYADGSYYDGEWKSNYRHGSGRYQYSSGDFYYGMWFLNKKHGIGVYYSIRTKSLYRGMWKLGERNGPGVLVWKNISFLLQTSFQHDECCNEKCVFLFQNKIQAIGVIENLRRNAWTLTDMRISEGPSPLTSVDRYAELNVEGRDEKIVRTVSEVDDLTDYITNYTLYKQIMLNIADYLLDETMLQTEIRGIMDLLVDRTFANVVS